MPKTPGLGAAQAAGAFGSIKDAIEMYMKLRDKKSDDQRQARQDQLGRDRFGLEQANSQLDARKAEASMKESHYKTIADVLDNYGGQTVQGGFAQDVMASPYASALKPHRGAETLPSTTMGTINQSNAGAPGAVEPGVYDVIPSASEKYRSAIAGITSRQGMNDANNNTRMAVAKLTADAKAKQFAQMMGYRWESLNEMQKARMLALSQQADMNQARVDDMNVDNQYRFENPSNAANPFAALLGQLGVPPGTAGPATPKRNPPSQINLGGDWVLEK